MFYVFFIALGMLVFYYWKRNDLELLSLRTDTKALSRSLGGSTLAADWLHSFILEFEIDGVSYLPFLTSLEELGDNFRRHNRKLLSCYGAKSCHILVIFVAMTSLNFHSNINFCLVILIFSGLTVYSLSSWSREQLLCGLRELSSNWHRGSLDLDFAHLNERNELAFKRKYTLLATLGTLAELSMFLFGITQASHFLEG